MPAMRTGYAQQYEDLWKRHWWWRARERFVTRWLERTAAREQGQKGGESARRPVRRILDVGCGNGLFFDTLGRFGRVRGIEPDASLVSADGPYREKIDIRGFDSTYLPAAGEAPDWILMLDVLEHLADDAAAVRHVREILSPGGMFLVTVPALGWLWSAHDDANLHFRRYNKQTLRQVLETIGFEIQVLHYFFGWTVGPMVLRRMLSPGRGPLPERAPGKPGGGETDYRVAVPAGPINSGLRGLCATEQAVFGRCGLPIGSSLLAIARKPAKSA